MAINKPQPKTAGISRCRSKHFLHSGFFVLFIYYKQRLGRLEFADLIIMIIAKHADAGFHCHKIYVKIRRLLL
jgi:hypothetical protein